MIEFILAGIGIYTLTVAALFIIEHIIKSWWEKYEQRKEDRL